MRDGYLGNQYISQVSLFLQGHFLLLVDSPSAISYPHTEKQSVAALGSVMCVLWGEGEQPCKLGLFALEIFLLPWRVI